MKLKANDRRSYEYMIKVLKLLLKNPSSTLGKNIEYKFGQEKVNKRKGIVSHLEVYEKEKPDADIGLTINGLSMLECRVSMDGQKNCRIEGVLEDGTVLNILELDFMKDILSDKRGVMAQIFNLFSQSKSIPEEDENLVLVSRNFTVLKDKKHNMPCVKLYIDSKYETYDFSGFRDGFGVYRYGFFCDMEEKVKAIVEKHSVDSDELVVLLLLLCLNKCSFDYVSLMSLDYISKTMDIPMVIALDLLKVLQRENLVYTLDDRGIFLINPEFFCVEKVTSDIDSFELKMQSADNYVFVSSLGSNYFYNKRLNDLYEDTGIANSLIYSRK